MKKALFFALAGVVFCGLGLSAADLLSRSGTVRNSNPTDKQSADSLARVQRWKIQKEDPWGIERWTIDGSKVEPFHKDKGPVRFSSKADIKEEILRLEAELENAMRKGGDVADLRRRWEELNAQLLQRKTDSPMAAPAAVRVAGTERQESSRMNTGFSLSSVDPTRKDLPENAPASTEMDPVRHEIRFLSRQLRDLPKDDPQYRAIRLRLNELGVRWPDISESGPDFQMDRPAYDVFSTAVSSPDVPVTMPEMPPADFTKPIPLSTDRSLFSAVSSTEVIARLPEDPGQRQVNELAEQRKAVEQAGGDASVFDAQLEPLIERRDRHSLDDNGGTTFNSAHGPIDIPNRGCAEGSITVAGQSPVIWDVEVQVDTLTYDWDIGLIDIYLISPAGDTCTLSTGNGGNGRHYYNTRFDDDAGTAITAGTAPFTGSFRPEESLSIFDGENPNGVWKLRVCDNEDNTATLRRWRIQILAGTAGDICATATTITMPASVTGNNCSAADNYNHACPYSNTGGRDVVYQYTPAVTQNVTFSLCRSNYDTKLMIYEGSCAGTPIACNDDADPCPGALTTYRSKLECQPLTAGHTYYIVVDAYSSSNCGNYSLEAGVCAPCDVQQQYDDHVECAETPDTSHSRLDCDGGTNNTGYGGAATYEAIACGQTCFGRGFTYINRDGGTSRDTDFYLFTLNQPDSVRVTAVAEFSVMAIIADTFLNPLAGTAEAACDTLRFTSPPLPAGNYYLFIAPSEYSGIPIPAPYRARLDCFTNTPGRNCSNAIEFTGIQTLGDQTTCGLFNDYGNTCLNAFDSGEDIIYRWIVAEENDYTVWMNPRSMQWTGFVLDNQCPPRSSDCLGASTSSGSNAHGIQCITLQPDTYFVMVDIWSPPLCISSFDLMTGYCYPSCVTLRPGDVVECAETPDTAHCRLDCNGGCNNPVCGGVYSWSTISSGQTIYGRSFTYGSADGYSYRDTDFYRFTLTERDCVTVIAKAEFPLSLGILDTHCVSLGYWYDTNQPCDTVILRMVLEAGSYALFAGPSIFSGIPVPRNYRLHLEFAPWAASIGTDCSQPQAVENEAILLNETNCYSANDYTETCLSDFDEREDHLYRWHVTIPGSWKIWLDPHGAYYTGFGLDEACPPELASCLATSISMSNMPHGISSVVLDTGSYYVMTDGQIAGQWCMSQYDLYFQRNCVVCSPGDIEECAEVMDNTHATLDCNGGCQNQAYGGSPQFSTISDGGAVCGNLFQYWRSGQRLTDIDYYLFTTTQVETVRVTVHSDVPFDIGIVDTNSCLYEAVLDWTSTTNYCDSLTLVLPCLAPGTYAIFVTGNWESVFAPGRYRMTLQYSATSCPLRDGRDCAHTIGVTSGTTLRSQSTCPMQADYDNTCLGGFDGGADVVYQWNITTAGNYYLWMDPYGTYYTGLLLDDECPPSPDNCLAVAYNDNSGPYGTPCVYLEAGTYYVIVDTWPWPYCIPRFDLSFASCDTCVVCEPGDIMECLENADSSNAAYDCNGGCNNATSGGTNQFGSITGGQTICGRGFTFVREANPNRDTDWFAFSLSEAETVRVTAFTEFPAMIAIVDTLASCPEAYIVSAVFTEPCDTTELVMDSLWAGSHFLWVGPSVFEGVPLPRDYRVTLTTIPHASGKDCAHPLAATDAHSFLNLTTCGFLNDYDSTCLGAWDGGQDLIVEWTVTQAGSYTISLNPHGTNWTAMALSTSCPPSLLGCVSLSTLQGLWSHAIPCMNLAPGTYYLMVDTWPEPDCLPVFDLTFQQQASPANDECLFAAPLTSPSVVYGSTFCASWSTIYDGCVDTLATYGVWYSITGNGNGMTATLCSTAVEWDAKLSLYSCDCSNLTCVAAADDNCGSLPSIQWCSRVGETYLLFVHGWGTYRGDFRLDVSDDGTPCPFGERCPCWHYTVTAPGQTTGSTVGANSSCSWFPYPDRIVRVSIPSPGYWNFSLCGSDFDTYLMLGTDCCLHDIATADNYFCDGDFSLNAEVCVYLPTAGYYYAAVEGMGLNEVGTFILNVQPSDGFIPPQVSGVSATNNLCGTVQVNWNDVAGEEGYKIWSSGGYAWRALADCTHSMDYWGTSGVIYSYTVTAMTACGESPQSLPDSGMAWEEVSQVTGVFATDTSCLNIFISWYDVASEDGFRIYRNGVQIGTTGTDVVSFMDTPGTGTFGYTVRGFNSACGDGPLSAADSGTVYPGPTPVTNVTASTWYCDRVELTWTDAQYETSYRIYRDGSPLSSSLPANTTAYTDCTAVPGVNHIYGVNSINLCGSQQIVASGTRLTVPPQVMNVAATDSLCNGVFITWAGIAGEIFCEVHRNGSMLMDSLPGNSANYLDTTAVPGTVYAYAVCARNLGCIGPCSTPDSGRRRALPQQAPIASLPDPCQSHHVCWTTVPDADGYRIWQDQTLLSTVSAATLCTDIVAAPQPFLVQISAINACGEGPRSAPIQVGYAVLPQISNLTATDALCDRVDVTWSVVGAAEGFAVYRDNVFIGFSDTTLYSDTTAAPFVVYAYSAEGHNDCGTGARSATDSGSRDDRPAQVANVTATQNRCDSVIVTWTDLSNEIGYRIYRDGNVFVAGPNITRFADAPAPGSYIYSVRATNACGDGPMSDSTAGIRLTAPGIPSSITASDDQCGSVILWWGSAVGDVDEYRFFRDGSFIGSALPDAESFVDNPVTGRHAYTVAAFSTECGLGGQSAVDSGNGRQPPSAISGLGFVSPPTCDSIRLAWQAANGDVDGYAVMRDGVVVDTALATHYSDYAVDDDNDHPYTVTAFNTYCGGGPTATPVMGNELPLLEIVSGIPDTIPSGQWFVMNLRHCSGVDSCRFFLSLNHGGFAHLRTILPSASDSLFFEPVSATTPDCRLRVFTVRDLRIDTMTTRSFVLRAATSAVDPLAEIPKEFFLDQNYPNPFNPATTIRFGVPHTAEITIEVFDVLGRKTTVLISDVVQAGVHTVVWDCSGCPTGMYLIRMQSDSRVWLKKVLLMK